jgi:hypothetical protein
MVHHENSAFEIRLEGRLHGKWAGWLGDENASILEEVDQTCIFVSVPDQAALRGFMNRLWDLNLTILSVTRINEES